MGIPGSFARRAATAALLVAASIGGAGAEDLTGTYTVEGKNPNGSAYGGTATIEGTEGGVCAITWATGTNQISRAFCMRQGEVLGAAYVLGDAVGLVIYRLGDNGVLEGTWSIAGQAGVGEETLTPQ